MTDISVLSTPYQVAKRSWYLGTSENPGFTVSGTLDVSNWDQTTYWPNGYIASGELVALSAGLYVPYVNGTSEVQKLTVATSGNTTLTFQGDSAAATSITADGTGAGVAQGLLEGLPDIDPGDITVVAGSGGDAGKLIVTFSGKRWAGKDVPPIGIAGTGTAAATSTAGGTEVVTGSGTCVGILFSDVRIPNPLNTAIDVGAAILVAYCPILLAKLPRTLDASGQADLKNLYFVGTGA